jgi:hypothetical protein
MVYRLVAQGALLTGRTIAHEGFKRKGGGTRGAITKFSRASRLRLLKTFARLDAKGKRAVFITLTLADEGITPSEAKGFLFSFLKRIGRRFRRAACIWRMELQKRGAVHFHLLMFNIPYIDQRALQRVWTQVTGEKLSIVHIKLVRSYRMLVSYVAKYMGKDGADVVTSLDHDAYLSVPQGQGMGRSWGIWGKVNLPFGDVLRLDTFDYGTARYLWSCVYHWTRGRGTTRFTNLTYFTDEAREIWRHFDAIRGDTTDSANAIERYEGSHRAYWIAKAVGLISPAF